MNLNLSEIKARCEAASPGPWNMDLHSNEIMMEGYQSIAKPFSLHVSLEQRDLNGFFIAHARTDIPLLLDEIDQLKAQVEAQQEWIDATVANCSVFCDPPSINAGAELVQKLHTLEKQVEKARKTLRQLRNDACVCAGDSGCTLNAKSVLCVATETLAALKEGKDVEHCGDCDPCLGGRPDQCAIFGKGKDQ